MLNLSTSLDILAGQDIAELEAKAQANLQAQKKVQDEAALKKTREDEAKEKAKRKSKIWSILRFFGFFWHLIAYLRSENLETIFTLLGLDWLFYLLPNPAKVEDASTLPPLPPALDPGRDVQPLSDQDSIFLGLKVYSQAQAPVVAISGQLRHQSEVDLSPALALPLCSSYSPPRDS